jgi:hypothetical protein
LQILATSNECPLKREPERKRPIKLGLRLVKPHLYFDLREPAGDLSDSLDRHERPDEPPQVGIALDLARQANGSPRAPRRDRTEH